MKKTVRDVDVREKRVLVRVDFNVPLEKGGVADDTRIRSALPTIRYLMERGARVILCSHLGRPKGGPDEKLRMNPVADKLSELLGMSVAKAADCIGPQAESAVNELRPGQVLLLENTRFHPEEKKNDPDFAAALAKLADLYVNDAFGTAHRADASTEGVAHHLPAVAGLLMEEELKSLGRVVENPERPFAAIFGGAKISDKIGIIDRFLDRVDLLLIGGGMANTLLKAKGYEVGLSLVEDESLDTAEKVLKKGGEKLTLPVDAVVADAFEEQANRRTVSIDQIPPDWRIMDIGPRSIDRFKEKLEQARMVVWNGPLGVTEMPPFAEGTNAVARMLSELPAVSVIGGGDSVAAVQRAGVARKITHISTGGGAFLTFMEGKTLPGVEALLDK
jgi:phosphoglycerate kinase